MRFDWLINVLLVLHFGYVAYLVVGGFFAWRWPRLWFVHLAAALWAVMIVFDVVSCPLTWAENWARVRSGQPKANGFIAEYLTGVIYPPQYLNQVQAAVAVLVAISWAGTVVFWRRRRTRRAANTATSGRAATV